MTAVDDGNLITISKNTSFIEVFLFMKNRLLRIIATEKNILKIMLAVKADYGTDPCQLYLYLDTPESQ